MLKLARPLVALLAFIGVLATAIQTQAAGGAADQTAPKVPVTTTVTVLGPKFTAPPPLTRQDINAYSGKTRLDVLNWVPRRAEHPSNWRL